jgi:hypothetical protein
MRIRVFYDNIGRVEVAMGGKKSEQPVKTIKPEPRVYQDHIDILRRMNAPEDLIQIAVDVAAANGVQTVVKT